MKIAPIQLMTSSFIFACDESPFSYKHWDRIFQSGWTWAGYEQGTRFILIVPAGRVSLTICWGYIPRYFGICKCKNNQFRPKLSYIWAIWYWWLFSFGPLWQAKLRVSFRQQFLSCHGKKRPLTSLMSDEHIVVNYSSVFSVHRWEAQQQRED